MWEELSISLEHRTEKWAKEKSRLREAALKVAG
jgi:hypothetical protein